MIRKMRYLVELGSKISVSSQGRINTRNNGVTWSGKIAEESECILFKSGWVFVLFLVLLLIIGFCFCSKNVDEEKELE